MASKQRQTSKRTRPSCYDSSRGFSGRRLDLLEDALPSSAGAGSQPSRRPAPKAGRGARRKLYEASIKRSPTHDSRASTRTLRVGFVQVLLGLFVSLLDFRFGVGTGGQLFDGLA